MTKSFGYYITICQAVLAVGGYGVSLLCSSQAATLPISLTRWRLYIVALLLNVKQESCQYQFL